MDLLGIKDSTASRPSLISSMWSLQVQQPQDANTIMDIQMGSQQSLPEILNSTIMDTQFGYPMEQTSSIRPSKSLSELSQYCKDSRMMHIHEAPSFIWKRGQDPHGRPPPPTLSTSTVSSYRNDSTSTLSRQQRRLCEWLERLNCADDRSIGAGRGRGLAVSPTQPAAVGFDGAGGQMSGSGGTASFAKQTPMQH
ncbi:hypothetical protein M3Y99_00615900 [Aphelenchoides fujianensis]|nr:hypothetical protein M3Y99_00615900 [Aphelenchoides fujianensis]